MHHVRTSLSSPSCISLPATLSISPVPFLSLVPALLLLTPSLPDSSWFLSLHAKTPETRFKNRHASTFSYTNVHFRGPAGTISTTPRRLHILRPLLCFPFPSLSFRLARSHSLSLSLSLSLLTSPSFDPSDSLLFSIPCVLARRSTRPCCAAVVSQRREEPEQPRELAVREMEIRFEKRRVSVERST